MIVSSNAHNKTRMFEQILLLKGQQDYIRMNLELGKL